MIESLIVVIFVIGYVLIVLEHITHINKTVAALMMGVGTWAVIGFVSQNPFDVSSSVYHNLGHTAGILFFLMAAMTLIELIDAHRGFDLITNLIKTKSLVRLLWLLAFTTFFMSAIIDNLTTSIIMVTLLRKLIDDKKTRMIFCGIIIISANAGGAWSPIGDVTTTMLWIGGQVSTINIISTVFLASLVSIIVPLIWLSYRYKGQYSVSENHEDHEDYEEEEKPSALMLILGMLGFLFVPIFKEVTHLPPHMGMLVVLAICWFVSELINSKKDEEEARKGSVKEALKKVDYESILFFLGILMAIGALEISGILHTSAELLANYIGNEDVIVIAIGLFSAVIDNVPLVAASQGMYDMSLYPMDHKLWSMMAYSAGTGGSILIIGSVAGVAVMGMEKIEFMWYVKHIAPLAIISFFSGIAMYLLQYWLIY